MPALKLLLRRTISTTTALNLPSPSPSPLLSSSSMTTHSLSTIVYCTGGGVKNTLVKKGGACLKHTGAQVKTLTKIKPMIIGNQNINIYRKKVFMLYSSSSPISSSSSTEETESSSEGQGMGRENNNINDGDWISNGAVLPPNDKDQKKGKKDDHCYDTKLLTLPTVLTLARVAAIPVFIGTFYVNSWWGAAATTSLFVAAAITDWLDGYLARRMRLGTAFGAFLDPVADKLMVAATLVLLCNRAPEIAVFGDIPWLFPVPAIAIIGREITMSAVREWAASQDAKLLQAVAVNNLGKWKTATQMTALTIILATRDNSVVASQGALAISGVALLYVSAGLAVWSLVVYMKKIWKVLMRK